MAETVTIVARPSPSLSLERPKSPRPCVTFPGAPAQALRREERRMHPACLSEHKFCWLPMPGRATKKSQERWRGRLGRHVPNEQYPLIWEDRKWMVADENKVNGRGAHLGLARASQKHDLGLVAYIAYRSDGKKRA